jgi:phosphoribosylglycinamide formyltransferase-1
MNRLAVFASGAGTNFDAIMQNIDNEYLLDCSVVLMVCDHLDAPVIEKAKLKNIEVFAFSANNYDSKDDYEKDIVKKCKEKNIDLIVLAGYMRILADRLLNSYPNKIINVHPSLLPAFKGKDAIGQAINYGVKVMGVTIHYVNSEMDGGEIIAQRAFDVLDKYSKEEIEQRVHRVEHKLYSEVIKKLLEVEDI